MAVGGWCLQSYVEVGWWDGAYGSIETEDMRTYLSQQDGKYLVPTMFYCWENWLWSKNKTDIVQETQRRCRGSQTETTLTYVSGSGRHGSPPLSDKLVGIKANLNDVVKQSQEGSQRESCYKDGGEAKLENWTEERTVWMNFRGCPSQLWHYINSYNFSIPLQTNITHQKGLMFYPFQGIHRPVHGRSSAADSSLCPTVEAGIYSLHSALHHLLSSSSYETTSSAANWKCSK